MGDDAISYKLSLVLSYIFMICVSVVVGEEPEVSWSQQTVCCHYQRIGVYMEWSIWDWSLYKSDNDIWTLHFVSFKMAIIAW